MGHIGSFGKLLQSGSAPSPNPQQLISPPYVGWGCGWVGELAVWVGGSFSKATTSTTSKLPFYTEEGLELLPSFGGSSLDVQVMTVARQKPLLSKGKKWGRWQA